MKNKTLENCYVFSLTLPVTLTVIYMVSENIRILWSEIILADRRLLDLNNFDLKEEFDSRNVGRSR